MRKLVPGFFLALTVLLVHSQVQAQLPVQLPQSGQLAGPLDSEFSQFGNEFLFFPFPPGPKAMTAQTGWIEIQFAQPQGSLVEFGISFNGVGPNSVTEFATGQIYRFTDETLLPLGGGGVLNLDTGEIEDIVVGAAFENSVISGFGKLNRIAGTFRHVYPPNLTGLPLPPLPPGFVFAEASFIYASDGSIIGFDFSGLGLAPIGIFSFLPGLPRYAFGPQNQVYFPNPTECNPSTPPQNCPDDATAPDGVVLPFQSILHPNTSLFTEELREVPVTPDVPTCGPVARSASVAASVGDQLYAIGGDFQHGGDRRRTDIYDLTSNSWQSGPRAPKAAVGSQGAAIGGTIYVAGGRPAPNGSPHDELQALDTASLEWHRLQDLPAPVADGAAVAFDGKLYVIGGLTKGSHGIGSGDRRLSDVVQVYDPSSGSWSTFPAIAGGQPLLLEGHAAAATEDAIYVINGRGADGSISQAVWVLDPVTETFSAAPETLQGVYEAVAATIDGRIYLSGGRSAVDGPSDARMQVLEIDRDLWSKHHPQPFATADSAGSVLADRLYIVAGRSMASGDDYPGLTTQATQYFDPARGWQSCGEIPLFNADNVLNTASLSVGSTVLSPGSQATLDGLNLAAGSAIAPAGQDVPTTLGGISLSIDGEDAPILAVSPTRIDFQIPYTVRTDRKVDLALTRDDAATQAPTIEIPIAEAAPGIFIQSCNRIRDRDQLIGAFALACHEDGSLNYASNAIDPGDVLVVQMTGLGAVSSALANGQRAPAGVEAAVLPSVRIEDTNGDLIDATVLSATLAEGEVGIYDVRVAVPASARLANRVRIEATASGRTSNLAVVSVGASVEASPLLCARDTNPVFRACGPIP